MSGTVPLLTLYAFMAWTGTFFLIFHMRATCRANQVLMGSLCSVKLPSLPVLSAATLYPPVGPVGAGSSLRFKYEEVVGGGENATLVVSE